MTTERDVELTGLRAVYLATYYRDALEYIAKGVPTDPQLWARTALAAGLEGADTLEMELRQHDAARNPTASRVMTEVQ